MARATLLSPCNYQLSYLGPPPLHEIVTYPHSPVLECITTRLRPVHKVSRQIGLLWRPQDSRYVSHPHHPPQMPSDINDTIPDRFFTLVPIARYIVAIRFNPV